MDASKKNIRHILHFFFDKSENASQAAENVKSVYGSDTVGINDAPHSEIVDNFDKIMEIV